MGSSKKQTVGYKYFMGLHFGICQGPVDALLRIVCGDRVAWTGSQATNGAISIDAPELFGGDEREGGVKGALDVMMGADTQIANAYLAAVQGGTQSGYRGLLSAVFRQGLIGSNNPYIKPWAFTVQRITAGWYGGSAWHPEKAAIAIGELESVQLSDDFGTLGGWTVIYGDETIFSASGNVITCESRRNFDTAELRKSFSPVPASVFSIRVRVDNDEDDDAALLVLDVPGIPGGVYFNARREVFFDLQRRPIFSVGGVTSSAPAAMEIGQWYRLEVRSVQSGATWLWTMQLIVESTGAVVGTFSRSGLSAGLGALSSISFLADNAPGAPTTYQTTQTSFSSLLLRLEVAYSAMNPAHIVYQCLTDPEWGMGYSSTIINDASFRAAADTFHAEGLGLCLHWTQQQPIEAFIQTVMDHAGAVLRQDPRTGLFEIKPLRDDYVASSLPLFDESNIRSVDSFERAGATGSVNEVTVRYDDAQTGKPGSVTVQNLAAVTSAGGPESQSASYPGLPTAALAARVAMRDLRTLSTPLSRVRMQVNRSGYSVLPGDVVRMAWPKLGITQLVLRVARVKAGSLTDGMIEIEAVEDVFGLGASTYVAQQPPGWQEPSTQPQPIATQVVTEAPYYELQRDLSAADLAALPADAGYLLVGAARPSGAALNFRISTRPAGSGSYEEAGTGDFCAVGTLAGAMNYTTTAATLATVSSPGLIEAGTYALLGPEIVRVDAYDAGTNALTLGRGVLDTVASTHAAGSTIFFLGSINASDSVERVGGEAVDVKLLTVAGGGALAETAAAADTLTFAGRAARPYPPGRVRVNSQAYPSTAQSPIVLSWAHRNRLQQNLEGDESGNIGPEAGTTYSAALLDAATNLPVASASAVAGSSWTVSPPPFGGAYFFELWSVRAGIQSLQKHRFPVSILGPVSDPFFSQVVLLLHCDGADNSTTFTDSSSFNRAVTVFGNTKISTAQARFGSASGLFDGSGDYLRLADNDAWHFGSGNFTIECWVRCADFPTSGQNRGILGQSLASSNRGWIIYIPGSASREVVFQFWQNDSTVIAAAGSSGNALSLNTWHHVAVVRNGSSFMLFIDGTLRASATSAATLQNSTAVLDIGTLYSGSGVTNSFFNGHIDEVRITNGVARYISNFTPPSAAFPDNPAAGATGALLTAAASLIPGTATNGNATAPGDPTILDALFPIRASLHRGAAYNDLPASTLLLLHMDGTNGSTTFTDSSTYAHSITAARSAAITTADKIAGTGALNLPGDGVTNVDGDFLTVGTAGTRPAAFASMFNGSDWTVEGWAKVGAAGGGIFAIGRQNPDLSFVGTLLQFRPPSFGNPPAFAIVNPAGGTAIYNGATQCPIDMWFHFAIVSTNGGQVRCYVNGVNSGSFFVGASPTPQNFVSWVLATAADMNPRVGGYSFPEPAKIDELRVLNYARYASDFTPPTPPFADP